MNENIVINVDVDLGPNCMFSLEYEFDTEDALPIQDIGLVVEDCSADIYSAMIIDENVISGLTPIDSSIWMVELNGVTTTYNSLPQQVDLLPTDILTV